MHPVFAGHINCVDPDCRNRETCQGNVFWLLNTADEKTAAVAAGGNRAAESLLELDLRTLQEAHTFCKVDARVRTGGRDGKQRNSAPDQGGCFTNDAYRSSRSGAGSSSRLSSGGGVDDNGSCSGGGGGDAGRWRRQVAAAAAAGGGGDDDITSANDNHSGEEGGDDPTVAPVVQLFAPHHKVPVCISVNV